MNRARIAATNLRGLVHSLSKPATGTPALNDPPPPYPGQPTQQAAQPEQHCTTHPVYTPQNNYSSSSAQQQQPLAAQPMQIVVTSQPYSTPFSRTHVALPLTNNDGPKNRQLCEQMEFWLGLTTAICCFCIPGVLAIWYATDSIRCYRLGQNSAAARKNLYSKLWSVAGLIAGLVVWMTLVPLLITNSIN